MSMNDHLAQLRDPDPAVRKAAIKALASRKDRRALRPLAHLYQNDPDQSVRELAHKAGAYIHKHTPPTQEAPAVDAAAPKAPEPPPELSPRDRQKAQSFLDRAVDYHMRGDKGRVAENLTKAVTMNPELRKDPMAMSMAAEIVGGHGPEAVDQLLQDESGREKLMEQSRQMRQARRQAEDDTDVGATFAAVAIYAILIIVGIAVLFLLIVNIFTENLDDVMPSNDPQLESDVKALTVGVIVIVALVMSLSQTIGLILQAGSIHVFAKYLMIGKGTFLGFLYRYTILQIIVVALVFGWFIAFLATAEPGLFFMGAFLGTLGGLYYIYYLSRMIARYYDFGTFTGFLAIVLGSILLFMMQAGFAQLLQALVQALV